MSDNFNSRHPEKRKGERWIGNFTEAEYARLPHRTKRRGERAYLPDGSALTSYSGRADVYPVFVGSAEHRERTASDPKKRIARRRTVG